MITLSEYLDLRGRSPFRRWLDRVDSVAAARIVTTLYRLETGNFSSLRSIGGGLFESRLDFGPGYRIYLGRVGSTELILLGGGSKRRQATDIVAARKAWLDFRRRERQANGEGES